MLYKKSFLYKKFSIILFYFINVREKYKKFLFFFEKILKTFAQKNNRCIIFQLTNKNQFDIIYNRYKDIYIVTQ